MDSMSGCLRWEFDHFTFLFYHMIFSWETSSSSFLSSNVCYKKLLCKELEANISLSVLGKSASWILIVKLDIESERRQWKEFFLSIELLKIYRKMKQRITPFNEHTYVFRTSLVTSLNDVKLNNIQISFGNSNMAAAWIIAESIHDCNTTFSWLNLIENFAQFKISILFLSWELECFKTTGAVVQNIFHLSCVMLESNS